MAIQIRRTRTNNPPTGLVPGQLAVEMASNPPRLWVGVPMEIDPTGRREIVGAEILAQFATPFVTGDLKPTHAKVAPAGWIGWIDGSIGDASSNATIRAAADTQALFTLYYDDYAEADVPLQTSTGAATTRAAQGTASAAFAAHCRQLVPRAEGRAFALAGSGSDLTVRAAGEAVGTETETQTSNTLAGHNHMALGVSVWGEGQISAPAGYLTGAAPTQMAGGGAPMNIMQPTTFLNVMIKL